MRRNERRHNISVRPSKGQAVMGFVMGCLFVVIGLGVVLPAAINSGPWFFGAFGLVWTGMAVYFCVSYGRVLFGKKDAALPGYQLRIDSTYADGSDADPAAGDAETRLTQLRSLYDRGLITEEEYEAKRKEILDQL